MFHFFIIKHFLLLILRKLKYANQGQSNTQSNILPEYFIPNIDSLKKCIDAMTDMHQITFQLHYLFSQTVYYNTYLLKSLLLLILGQGELLFRDLGRSEGRSRNCSCFVRLLEMGYCTLQCFERCLIIVNTAVFINDLLQYYVTLLLGLLCFNSTLILFLKLPNLFIEQLHQFPIFHNNLFILLTLSTYRYAPSMAASIFVLVVFYHRKLDLQLLKEQYLRR